MIQSSLKYVRYLLLLLISVGYIVNGFSQEQLNFGTSNLSEKKIAVDKYFCSIAPSITIAQDKPDNIKLTFKINWLNKDNLQIAVPDKFSLFIKYNDNIDVYCTTNDKKLSTKSGLFGKGIDFTNSISILPAGMIELAPYKNILFVNGAPPFNGKILKNNTEPVNLNLTLYLGKEKNNAVDIDEKLELISWVFILPAVKQTSSPTEKLSCAELENKYNQVFKENQPQFYIGYYESKLLEIESGSLPVESLYELQSSIYKFQMNIDRLNSLKADIQKEPDYNNCVSLPVLVGSINNYLTEPAKIDAIINKINAAIISGGGTGGTGGPPPYEAFDQNLQFSQSTFDQLYEIKLNPTLLGEHDDSFLPNLKSKLNSDKIAQDSLYNVILANGESPEYTRKYKAFKEYNQASIEIVNKFLPENQLETNTEKAQDETITSKRKHFPITWIIIPILAILLGFGVYKYLAMAKKGKKMNKKM